MREKKILKLNHSNHKAIDKRLICHNQLGFLALSVSFNKIWKFLRSEVFQWQTAKPENCWNNDKVFLFFIFCMADWRPKQKKQDHFLWYELRFKAAKNFFGDKYIKQFESTRGNRSDLKRFASWVVTHNELVIVGTTFLALSEFVEFINSNSNTHTHIQNNTEVHRHTYPHTNKEHAQLRRTFPFHCLLFYKTLQFLN